MSKYMILGANKEIDTNVQEVTENQVIILDHYSESKWVVYKIIKNEWGITYHVVNIEDPRFETADFLRPISQKFGIGWYFDEKNPEYFDPLEVAILVQQATQVQQEEQEKEEQEKLEKEAIKDMGREWLSKNLPSNAKAMIVAYVETCDYNPSLDYQNYYKTNYQILGFSDSAKNSEQELRKYAGNFEGTKYLEIANDNDKSNEKGNYYLGYCNDWMIRKVTIQDRANFNESWAYIAGNISNIHIKEKAPNTIKAEDQITGDLIIVDYSAKSIAVFGNTKPIKDQLSAMNGFFNGRLTYNGEKKAGWIFSKSKEQEVKEFLGLNK